MPPPLRVAVILIVADNAYQRLLHAALEPHGVTTLPGRPTPWWMWRRRRDYDVIHLHWIEFLLNRRGGAPLAVAAFLSVVSSLWLARRLGKRVVWTVHNVQPHEQRHPRLQPALYRAVARLSDALVVHTEASAALVREKLPGARRVLVVPHGNYLGAYPPAAADRGATRARHGFGDEDIVLLAFGQIRPYKRLLQTARAVRGLDDDGVRLVIVGGKTDRAEAERLRAEAEGEARIVLVLGYVDDAGVAALHEMADASVVPYTDSFASGALLLGLGYGLPVMAPADGAAAEIALPDALIDFHGGDLTAAVAELRARGRERTRAAARESAERVPWSASAERLLDAYRAIPGTMEE